MIATSAGRGRSRAASRAGIRAPGACFAMLLVSVLPRCSSGARRRSTDLCGMVPSCSRQGYVDLLCTLATRTPGAPPPLPDLEERAAPPPLPDLEEP